MKVAKSHQSEGILVYSYKILVISYNLSVNKKCINGDKKDLNYDIKAPLQINLKVLLKWGFVHKEKLSIST